MRLLLGLVRVARGLRLWPLVTRVVEAAALLPPRHERARLAGVHPAQGRERGRVGLLVGCVGGELFAEVGAAACAC